MRYDPLETFNGQITTGYENTTNESVLEIALESLQEYVEYNISVRAYTVVGAGPFSDGIVQRTDEDSKSNMQPLLLLPFVTISDPSFSLSLH